MVAQTTIPRRFSNGGSSASKFSSVIASIRSSSSSRRAAKEILTSDKFVLISRSVVLFTVYGAAITILILAGIIRSCIMLAEITGRLGALKAAEDKLQVFILLEDMADIVYKESLGRVKYLSSGLNPTYYSEVSNAVNDNDFLFAAHTREFERIYFEAPEYRQYKCSFYRIRSNLESKSIAIPLTQHRSLDERNLNPWDDMDYYECLLALLADIHNQELATTAGFDYLWQIAVGYYLAMRSVYNLQVGINYAYLTRELILKKGFAKFIREEDAENLDDAFILSHFLITRADELTIGVSCKPASDALNELYGQFSLIRNATKAWMLVSHVEPATSAKTALALLIAAKDNFRSYMWQTHLDTINLTYRSIAAEAVKLFIFAVILPVLACQSLVHFLRETNRLKKRYEQSVDCYIEACKAVYRLLPEPVARQLNVGENIKPEFFHSATVFYSDIVGFTSICSKLSAIDVLAMLNTIYTVFDSRTNTFKCYKIETIGDAYVVASGVPTRISNHSAEIASLALVLIEEVGMIKIPHNKEKIRIRVGINSGPVIAAIVGLKMPRYCLFGKTVLYANRMEQTSQPQKVQISNSSYSELKTVGGFVITPRPREEWPDKKEPTYWLDGQTTNTLPLSLFKHSNANLTNARINKEQSE